MRSKALAGWILALSLVYTLAMFRGLEGHSAYFGNAYQALHPGSFSADLFMDPHRVTLSSFYYNVVRWVGPLWLDDRFTMLVFFLITVLSLVALDKTARLLGCASFWERLALMGLVLLEHKFFITHVLLVDNYGFNATAWAGFLGLWIFYGALAEWRPPFLLGLMGLGLWVSLKNAPFPVFIGLVLMARDRLGKKGQTAAFVAAAAAFFGALAFYYLQLRPADGSHPAHFDFAMRYMDDFETNPFLYSWVPNLVFAGFCLSAFLVEDLPAALLPKFRIVAGIGLFFWFFGGLYFTLAPDPLKIPYLVPLGLRRALRWPSYIVFVALAVSWIKQLQAAASKKKIWMAWAGLMVLYGLHQEVRFELIVLSSLLTLGMVAWNPRAQPIRVAALAMAIGTLGLYGVGGLRHRGPALRVLARHGIVGDNPSAKWVGVNEYLRNRTPADAMVLALSKEPSSAGGTARLHFDGSLRVRAGRAMPMGHSAAFYFDLEKLRQWQKRSAEVETLARDWEAHNLQRVAEGLQELGTPDYLVIPSEEALWLLDRTDFGYRFETYVRDFAIFRRL